MMNLHKQSKFQAPILGNDFVKNSHNFYRQKFEITWIQWLVLAMSATFSVPIRRKHQNIYLWPLSQPDGRGKVTLPFGGHLRKQKVVFRENMPDGGKACPAGEERAEGSALSMRQAAESIPRARLNRARSRVSTTFDISRSASWD